MAIGTTKGASGSPGIYDLGQHAQNSLFNDFNIIIPDWIPDMFAQYGTENYALIMQILNKTTLEDFTTTTQTFSHFEKGRSFGVGFVNSNVTGITPGAAVTFTLGPGSYQSNGTKTGFRLNEYVRIRSTGVIAQITAIPSTTPNAFQVTVLPAQTTQAFASGSSTGTQLNQLEAIELIGNIAAGEASGRMDTQAPFINRIDNTTTVIRDSAAITDVARMNRTQVNFGGGDQYYYRFLTQELNKKFLFYMENACLEGIFVNNIAAVTGTTGVIPRVQAQGGNINYLIGNATIYDVQNLTRQADYQGAHQEFHCVQEIKQRQDINAFLFGKYNNGAIRWATAGGTEELALGYGFQSFAIDSYTFHFYRYKAFSPQSVYGYEPTQGNFRDHFGLFVPQGAIPDAQTNSSRPNMQWVYQTIPDMPGTKIYTWETGAFSPNGKTDILEQVLNQACYVGARTICPQQFSVFQGVQS